MLSFVFLSYSLSRLLGGTNHPRVTIQQALCLRAKETKKQRRLLKTLALGSSGDLDNGFNFELSKGLDLSSDDDSVGSATSIGNESGVSGESSEGGDVVSSSVSTSSSHGGQNVPSKRPGINVIKLKPPTSQDIDFKTKSDKPIGEVLDNVKYLVHKHMLHAFHVQAYVLKEGNATGEASSRPKRRGIGRLRGAVRLTSRHKRKSSSESSLPESAPPLMSSSSQDDSSQVRHQSLGKGALPGLDSLSRESCHSQLPADSFHNDFHLVRQTSEDLDEDLPLTTVSTTPAGTVGNSKVEYDRLLKTGANSNSNPWVSKIGVLVQPMLESVLGVLGMVRAVYNLFTWRDPL